MNPKELSEEEILGLIQRMPDLIYLRKLKSSCQTTKLKRAYFLRYQWLVKSIWSLS